ncbi:MAG: hypothetical protein PHW65_00130 [Dehalococcoidales bacterium]|nr:hypothetical protein [Dehalococcoidales bacterium]
MHGYTKLFSEIITSSIWSEDDKTRIVWITMLALKDKDGYVAASIPGLADVARVEIADCERALTKLESPDKYSRDRGSDGRRIAKVEGGWIVINHEKYRNKLSNEDKNIQARERMRKWRERNRERNVTHVTRTPVYVSESSLKKEDCKGKEFEEFWQLYPRKVGKGSARRAFHTHKCKDIMEKIKKSIDIQKHSDQWQKDGGQFIPHPTTWINQERWNDEVTYLGNSPTTTIAQREAETLKKIQEGG